MLVKSNKMFSSTKRKILVMLMHLPFMAFQVWANIEKWTKKSFNGFVILVPVTKGLNMYIYIYIYIYIEREREREKERNRGLHGCLATSDQRLNVFRATGRLSLLSRPKIGATCSQ